MTAPIQRLDGIIPILSMPFHEDDTIDLDRLVAQAEWLTETGVHGVGFGFGSEIFRLTDAERDLALSAVARALAGRLPIIAATSATSTRATLFRSEAARVAGASDLMITPPAFASPTPDDIVAHYRTIAATRGSVIRCHARARPPRPPKHRAERSRPSTIRTAGGVETTSVSIARELGGRTGQAEL
jgi:dihydrodipicolinate synthase/N-acetylneuraminate lyase